MKRKLSGRRRSAGIISLILAVAIVVTGTLAWQAISQRALNNVTGELLPAGARLHDDFASEGELDFTQPLNKDVYVENYSGQNPLNTDDPGESVFVRVKLTEYMETGMGAGLFTVSGDDPSDYQTLDQVDVDSTRIEDPANEADSLVPGASILDLSTWRTHVEDDTANPFDVYWNWKMGGTKAFMPTFNKDNHSLLTDRTTYAHDEFAVGDKENGTAFYSNPTYDNNPEEHTAKNTLGTAGIVSMTEWFDLDHPVENEDGNGYWVGDTDGWYYWSKGLEAGEATALLLDQVTLTGTIEGEFYYGIHVISEMATAYDWGDSDDETGFYEDGLSEDGKFLLDQAAEDNSFKGEKLLYAPMDDTGDAIAANILAYVPMDGIGYPNTNQNIPVEPITEEITGANFKDLASNVKKSDAKFKVGGSSGYFNGSGGQRLNISLPKANFGSDDFTVSFWAYPETQVMGYALFFGNDSNGQFNFFTTDAEVGGPMSLAIGSGRILNTNKMYKANAWIHYAVVRHSGKITVYENGVGIGSVNYSSSINLSSLSIGGNASTDNTAYKGYLDDFAIYDFAKYTSNFSVPTTASDDAQVAYVDFEKEDASLPSYNTQPIREVITNKDMTIIGNPSLVGTDTQSKFGGSSLYFPGTGGQRINTSNSKLNFGTNNFTVSFWAHPVTQVVDYAIFFGNDSNGQLNFFATDGASSGNMSIDIGGGRILNLGKKYKPNVWSHYAVVRDSGTITVYENGVKIGSVYYPYAIDISSLSIGGNASEGNTPYKGYLDDFAVYSYAKYTGNFSVPTATAINDPLNISANPLSIIDEVTTNSFSIRGSAALAGRNTQSKFGGASLYFPGTPDQRINIQNPGLNFEKNDFTVSFWAYIENQVNDYAIYFGAENNDQLNFFATDGSSGGNMSLAIGTGRILNAGKSYTTNKWIHYAVVREGDTITLYENGINIGQADYTGNVDISNLSIGGNASGGNTPYKGYIDDFIIYNYAVWDSNFTSPTAAGTP